ncbi:hypothetical protein ACH3XW_21260 [Acanthocheilonema viteae]
MSFVTIIIIIAVVAIFYFFCYYGKQKSTSERNVQESGSSTGFRRGSNVQRNTATTEDSKYLTPAMIQDRSIHIGPN